MMLAVLAPTAAIHSRKALAMNSGPLSDRMWPGMPRRMNRSDRTSITSTAFSFRLHPDGDAFPCELIDHVEHAVFPSIVSSILDEVVGPDMVGIFRPKPDARTIVQPESSAFGLLPRGTFSPSRRQILSTRLTFTLQPARCSIAVMRRYP